MDGVEGEINLGTPSTVELYAFLFGRDEIFRAGNKERELFSCNSVLNIFFSIHAVLE